ncbi:TniQ family protein [Alcaligenaceae bacterium CGII-47]|nr:TniQ family protein [Alcaligenaceae bacterium CGII-47]
MPWAIHTPLQPDESISSWLARTALLQGCDPLALTGSVWPGLRTWSVDIDRGMSSAHFQALSLACGIGTAHFKQAALRTDAERIAGRVLADMGCWPWILTLGSRNRKRHSGQQFCPSCLASDTHPYFRRRWRFAWQVACTQHSLGLIDQCSTCKAPITPHQLVAEDRQLIFCSHCHADLRKMPAIPASDSALAFQQTADQVMGAGAGLFGNRTITMTDWFGTARFYASLIRRVACQKESRLVTGIRSLGVNTNTSNLPITGLPLELLPVADRTPILNAVQQLMVLGSEPLHTALSRNGITAASIHDSRSLLPGPLKEMLTTLPSGRRTTMHPRHPGESRPRTEAAVRGAWMRLQRKVKASLQ